MATNRPTTRRKSEKRAFDDDDAPAPKRPKTEVNGTSKRATATTKTPMGKIAAAKKTAKAAAYDEVDDGFQFSRRTSRRTTKAQAAPAPEPEPIPEEEPAKPARAADAYPAKAAPRPKKKSIAAIDPESSDSGKRRRSARLSGDREQLEVRPKTAKATEPPVANPRTKKSAPAVKERKKQVTPAPETQPEPKSAYAGVQTPIHNELQVAKKRDPNAQRIMLPFADTPVITRNKEMRKGTNKDGHRRSSTGLRGRRASSLIDSGQSNGESNAMRK
jgi:kinetochore protein Mis13/DSN1